jgi:hypothetical protein
MSVTPLPSKPTENQNPWYATMVAWMDGVALNVNELNADITNHDAATKHLPTGGLTGQVLKKSSSTNYDVSWQTESGGGTVTPPVSFTGTDASTIPLTITAAASQAAVIFDVQSSAGTKLFQIQNGGEVRLGPDAPNVNGTLRAGNTDPARRGIVYRAAASQTADLLAITNNSGTTLMKVASDGRITAPNVSAGVIVLNAADAVPAGTPAGTVILRRP